MDAGFATNYITYGAKPSMVKKGNTKLTISVNEQITKKFKKLCDEEGWKIGKQVEKYFLEVLINR